MIDTLQTFGWGVFGSFAVELVAAFRAVNENDGHLPKKFTRRDYVLTRILMLPAAGTLAIAFNTSSPVMAIYVGVTAPLTLDRLKQGVRPSLPGADDERGE